MSSDQIRSQLKAKRAQRVNAEKKHGDYRKKEAEKRTAAAKAISAAQSTSSASTAKSKLREADRYEREANKAGTEAARWAQKTADYAKEEAELQQKLTKAELAEAKAAERRRLRDQKATDQRTRADLGQVETRVRATEARVERALRNLPAPKPERLRILLLGATSDGDLRVSREQARIRAAVQYADGRDLVRLDVRPAATSADLLDGISRFKPHVVHFSGHSNDELLVFEDDVDAHHDGVEVDAKTFARVVGATDHPPLLIMLNSCHSAAQLRHLVDAVAPFAIGMSDTIDDADAISYAAQFYAGIANGQSINSAHLQGQVAVELAGLTGHDLPVLEHANDVDPATTVLVKPPPPD